MAAILAVAILAGAFPSPAGAAAPAMDRAALESALAAMQADVLAARDAYVAGDASGAREHAARVSERFTYDAAGSSDLEAAIKAASAAAVGDRVKALAARFLGAIEAGAPAADVGALADDLVPSLNRLVIIAQGKTSAASQRSLRTDAAVDAAVADVLRLVEAAVDQYAAGRRSVAAETAQDAFFTYEIDGLGPDTSTVDDDLENRVENLIVNFDKRTVATDPGLSQRIERGDPIDDVRAHAARIREAMAEMAELLKATLPPPNLGDANGDGRVTIVDALFVAQAALGIREKTGDMDANGDGRVTIVDALLIAQVALGIRTL